MVYIYTKREVTDKRVASRTILPGGTSPLRHTRNIFLFVLDKFEHLYYYLYCRRFRRAEPAEYAWIFMKINTA